MSRIFKLFGRRASAPDPAPEAAHSDAVESGLAAENEARRRTSQREADSQAVVNEARRQASDSEARSQAAANESRHRADEDARRHD